MRLVFHAVAWLASLLLLVAVEGAGAEVNYHDRIKPLLAVHCAKCHGAEVQKGGLRLDRAEAARRGGDSGEPAILPGASARSELMRRVTSQDEDEQMPPKGPRLTEDEIESLRHWVDAGAKWPERDDYWAFRPPADAPPPEGPAPHPIDRFIHARLAAEGIVPVGAADDRTLLRRAFFDLVGVPPSPEEADTFGSDRSPGAYERLVDRLLADPRYGELWARHWLDLVRYGESDGYEDDKVRPLAWRYRDYVVRALNADKPYDRFVQEQIAGDELWPDEPDAWIATGFARLGAWDGMSKEPEKQRQDFLNDATDAVGAAFLGMTLGCARCHDHKYDTITQRDYFAVQAHFAAVQRETRPLRGEWHEPPGVSAAWQAQRVELDALRAERNELWRAARAELESEPTAAKEKIDDEAVKQRAKTRFPDRLGRLDERIRALERDIRPNEPMAEAVFAAPGAVRSVRLLVGGELSRPGEEVAGGFIEAMLPPGAATSSDGRRAALARWLASPDHPLTARVMVNRVWQHHFGAGLVSTASDFGRNGQRPTHPELLDWLARELVRDGWSLKRLHRLIMTSAAYRRATTPDAAASAKDPGNKLLWRMNRRRLEGEAIRDTLLAVSGTLNRAMGGPGVYAALPEGINVEFPNNDKELSWGQATDADNHRRSLYLFQRRTLTYPLLEVFDSAPMNQSCAARAQTTVAPQALALFNGEFARGCAEQFAARLRREAGDDPARQIERAFRIAFSRAPGDLERTAARRFLETQAVVRAREPQAALTDFCHALLNTSELIYPD